MSIDDQFSQLTAALNQLTAAINRAYKAPAHCSPSANAETIQQAPEAAAPAAPAEAAEAPAPVQPDQPAAEAAAPAEAAQAAPEADAPAPAAAQPAAKAAPTAAEPGKNESERSHRKPKADEGKGSEGVEPPKSDEKPAAPVKAELTEKAKKSEAKGQKAPRDRYKNYVIAKMAEGVPAAKAMEQAWGKPGLKFENASPEQVDAMVKNIEAAGF